MAIPLLRAQVIGRSDGKSSTASAAYRAACRIVDVRTGETYDYTKKRGVREAFILTPVGVPDWMKSRETLWNGVELAEDLLNRKSSVAQVARELIIALPHELPEVVRRQLLLEFIQREFVDEGMVADVAIHEPGRDGDKRNVHAHVMLTMRLIDGDNFGDKERAWNRPALADKWKAKWAKIVNRALEAHGFDARIEFSHETKALAEGHDVALADLPTLHLGPTISAMERRGVRTALGDMNREVAVINIERARARKAAKAAAEKQAAASALPRLLLPGISTPTVRMLPTDNGNLPERKRPLAFKPVPVPAVHNPALDLSRRLVNPSHVPGYAPRAKAAAAGSTTSARWTAIERIAWRRRLVVNHYQTEIPDSLGALLSFVDRNSLPDCLQLRLIGGGQLADLGDKIEAAGHDLHAECRATVALCAAKGWKVIESSGPPDYLAMMRQEAERAGLLFRLPGEPAHEPKPDPDASDGKPRP